MAQVPSNLIPTRVTQLPDAPVASGDGLLLYTYNGATYKIRAGDLLQVAGVPTSRRVLAGTGLVGGGQLTSDLTLSIGNKAVGSELITDTGVAAGTYGGSTTVPQFTLGSDGRVTAASTGSVQLARSGANSDISALSAITGGVSTPDYIDFDTAATPTPAVGRLMWDAAEFGPAIGMAGGNVNLQIGQETVVLVYNNTGSALSDGQVVYCTGSQGQRLTVALALANSDLTSAAIIGVVTEPIPNNQRGFITVQGTIHNVNTHGYADGAVIYLSPTVPGGWSTTKPQAPQHTVMVGYIVNGGSAGAGSIYVHVQNGYELDELHDVKITSLTAGDFLQYDAAVPAWVNTRTPRLAAYTVATLPAAGTAGRVAYVTDALAPTYLGTLTGGGMVKVPVFDNGTAWVAH